MKELIRCGGEKVSLIEVETRLTLMPGVSDCVIVGVADAVMDEEIKAVLVCSSPIEPVAARSYLAGHFPAFMLPRCVKFVAAIPKTEIQKIQRNRLVELGPMVVDLSA
jgi:crotonobetaine/carnitine-CoA ligase